MAARGLVLLLIALLALPAAVVTPPTRARPASGVVAPESAPEAAKRKKKKSKKPKTVARTVRQTVTRTFASEEMVEAPAIGLEGQQGHWCFPGDDRSYCGAEVLSEAA